jgi:nicotinamide mononucleotide transporter
MSLFGDPSSSGWFIQSLLWVISKHLEIIATLTAIIYLVYSIQGDTRLWVYGLISSVIYVYICFDYGIYADMGINIYYVLVSIYGWIHWSFYKGANQKEIPYSRTSFKQGILIMIVSAALFIFIIYILRNYTNSTIPILDSFTTALSITATWMLARKMIEHWFLWIAVDSVSVGMYIYKGLYPTSFLFSVYTIMAISGYLTWKKKWKIQEKI